MKEEQGRVGEPGMLPKAADVNSAEMRTTMREVAETVIDAHANAFTDAHLMAVFVLHLLDHMEAAPSDRHCGAAITDPGPNDEGRWT